MSRLLSVFARLSLHGILIYSQMIGEVRAAETEAYFTPGEGCEARLVELISGASSSIELALHKFESPKLVRALISAKQNGRKIRVLLDSTQAKMRRETAVKLREEGVTVRLHSVSRAQHNSFIVIDSKVVVTGTYEWTVAAEKKDENTCVILRDAATVGKFVNRFEKHLWRLNTEEKSRRGFANIRARFRDRPSEEGRRRPGSDGSEEVE